MSDANSSPWALPSMPSNPTHTAKAHVLANSPTARLVRICYLTGPANSHVSVRANVSGGPNTVTNVYFGGCSDVGGTDVEITNPNSEPVSGTYILLDAPKSEA